MDIIEIGEALREARKKEGLTLEELSVDVDISLVSLSNLENGKAHNFGLSNLARVCSRLGLEFVVAPREHAPRAGRAVPR